MFTELRLNLLHSGVICHFRSSCVPIEGWPPVFAYYDHNIVGSITITLTMSVNNYVRQTDFVCESLLFIYSKFLFSKNLPLPRQNAFNKHLLSNCYIHETNQTFGTYITI